MNSFLLLSNVFGDGLVFFDATTFFLFFPDLAFNQKVLDVSLSLFSLLESLLQFSIVFFHDLADDIIDHGLFTKELFVLVSLLVLFVLELFGKFSLIMLCLLMLLDFFLFLLFTEPFEFLFDLNRLFDFLGLQQ